MKDLPGHANAWTCRFERSRHHLSDELVGLVTPRTQQIRHVADVVIATNVSRTVVNKPIPSDATDMVHLSTNASLNGAAERAADPGPANAALRTRKSCFRARVPFGSKNAESTKRATGTNSERATYNFSEPWSNYARRSHS